MLAETLVNNPQGHGLGVPNKTNWDFPKDIQILVPELLGSFLLVAVYIHLVLANKSFGVVAIGVICVYLGLGTAYGQLNGTPLNILRLLIPALFTKSRRVSWLNPGWWTYYVASIIGGVIGAFAAKFLFDTTEQRTEFANGGAAAAAMAKADMPQEAAKPMGGDPFQ